MPDAPAVCVLVATLAPLTLQGQPGTAQRSLPPPTDIDAHFTAELGQAEEQFCKAILNKDARTLAAGVFLRVVDHIRPGRACFAQVVDFHAGIVPRARVWGAKK